MKLSQLAAECTARLADLRARQGETADAECFVSFKTKHSHDQLDVEGVELWGSSAPYLEIKTEKEQPE